MKIILIFVSSLDGKVTKWGDSHVQKWSSKEDQAYFKKIWDANTLVIMGSGTYDAEPFKPPMHNHLLIVTSRPENYADKVIPGQLDFTSETPAELTARLEAEGNKQVLLVGGPHLATAFLKENLVDELWLTLEPKIFGTGSNFAVDEELDIKLKLLESEKVNEQGTLITKYAVLHD
ncbi:MAG: dihydrofolate reductase family protein [Bacteroidota bacterium]|nr:dihydrofolate reductase family protein [Bacteroidota bacterium]